MDEINILYKIYFILKIYIYKVFLNRIGEATDIIAINNII